MKNQDQKPRCLVISYWPPWEDVPGGIRMRRLLGGLGQMNWDLSLVTSGPFQPPDLGREISSAMVTPRLFQAFSPGPAPEQPDASSVDSEALVTNSLMPLRDSLAFSLRGLPLPRRATWLAWYPKIRTWAKSQDIDIIYSKSPPNSSHLLGRLLSQHLGVPWAAEFGDLWSQNPYYQGIGSWSRLGSALERWVLRPAKGLVTVSAPMAEQLSSLHDKPTKVIYNCFPQDPTEPLQSVESYQLTLPLRVLYAGRVYPRYRMPEMLFKALKGLLDKGTIGSSELELVFLCSNHGWLNRWMQRNYPSLAGICSVIPPVSLEEALTRQAQSHVLLTIGWFGQGHEGVVTSKFFEYLGSGRKVLCLLKEGGALENIGRQIPGVELVRNTSEAQAVVVKLVSQARKGGEITLPPDYWRKVNPYSCKEQAKRLSDFLIGLVSPY